MDNRYDVIVAGAGIVGSYFARRCAEAGLKVLLLDRRKADELGGWKNTGHNLDLSVFKDLPIDFPTPEETMTEIKKAVFRPPVGDKFRFDLPMVNVRLKEFTARMVREAVDADVDFRDQTRVKGPIIEDGAVKGLVAECGDRTEELRASVVADVSGIDAVVRGGLPEEFGFPAELSRLDYLHVYSEDWEVPDDEKIEFTYHPKWQGWSGPRAPGIFGIGLGRFAARDEDPREMFEEYSKEVRPEGGKRMWKTFNRVPLRHPLHSFVGDGVVMIGDSAIQGKPLNGEGISVMLYAAEMAKDAVAKAIKDEDVSAGKLWDYNVKWQRTWGARFSLFHRLRYEMLRMNSDELDFLLGLQLYGPDDMAAIMGRGEMAPITPAKVLTLLRAVGKGIERPDVLIRMARATIEGNKLKKLYEQYPSSPEGLPAWTEKVMKLYHYR